MKNSRQLRKYGQLVVAWGLVAFGCTQFVTVYWSKPGAGNAELQRDKDECQSLQRAVGLDESRIAKCLIAKGWEQVSQEEQTPASNSE